MIQVFTIGGYSEVGKNMTAVKVDDEIIILDMGLYLPSVLEYEEGDPHDLTTKDLIKFGATHINTKPCEVVVDKKNKIVTNPCYMLESTIVEIAEGAENVVKEMLKMM